MLSYRKREPLKRLGRETLSVVSLNKRGETFSRNFTDLALWCHFADVRAHCIEQAISLPHTQALCKWVFHFSNTHLIEREGGMSDHTNMVLYLK